jgi:hypothetical protein
LYISLEKNNVNVDTERRVEKTIAHACFVAEEEVAGDGSLEEEGDEEEEELEVSGGKVAGRKLGKREKKAERICKTERQR